MIVFQKPDYGDETFKTNINSIDLRLQEGKIEVFDDAEKE